MRVLKLSVLLLIPFLLLSGCLSRIGYPAKTVGIPTPVALFTRVAQAATITKNLDYMSREVWSFMYEKRTKDVLAEVSRERLQRQLNIVFSRNAEKAAELFAPVSSEVIEIDVEYSKTKNDPPRYSGFDLSKYKESVPVAYILALTIDEWGTIVAKKNEENGPFIKLTMQLIDKETNESAWSYTYLFQQPIDKAANELTKAALLDNVYERLITRAVDQYFLWLSLK